MILSNTMKSEVHAFIKKRLQKTEIIRTIVIKTPYALNNNETKATYLTSAEICSFMVE